eukprot:g7888.t1
MATLTAGDGADVQNQVMGVTVAFGTVQRSGERVEDYMFRVDAVPPTEREHVVNESRFQYTYTGVHDHGNMPELKLSNGMVNALQKAKQLSNEYLTKKLQDQNGQDNALSEQAKKKQKVED